LLLDFLKTKLNFFWED